MISINIFGILDMGIGVLHHSVCDSHVVRVVLFLMPHFVVQANRKKYVLCLMSN